MARLHARVGEVDVAVDDVRDDVAGLAAGVTINEWTNPVPFASFNNYVSSNSTNGKNERMALAATENAKVCTSVRSR